MTNEENESANIKADNPLTPQQDNRAFESIPVRPAPWTSQRETGSPMNRERALSMFRTANQWLYSKIKEDATCECGNCYLCAYNFFASTPPSTAAAIRAAAEEVLRCVLGFNELDDLAQLSPENGNRKYVVDELCAILSRYFGKGENGTGEYEMNNHPRDAITKVNTLPDISDGDSERLQEFVRVTVREVRAVGGVSAATTLEMIGYIRELERAQVGGDDYVAWCRYIYDESGDIQTIEACDSDAPGAFKVYRATPAAPSPGEPRDTCDHGISLDEDCLTCENQQDEVDVGSAVLRTSVEGESE